MNLQFGLWVIDVMLNMFFFLYEKIIYVIFWIKHVIA